MRKILSIVGACSLFIAPNVASAVEMISFEGFNAGDVVSEVYSDGLVGPIAVNGLNPVNNAVNAAMIFDSSNPVCDDDDLGSPNETCAQPGPGEGVGGEVGSPFENCTALNNLLIVSELNSQCQPDDQGNLAGAKLELDFSALGSVTLHNIDILDVEAGEAVDAEINLYGAGDVLLLTLPLPSTGNNGYSREGLGATSGVVRLEALLNGSGAIDNVYFSMDGEGCTPGYWRQLHHFDSWQGAAPTDDFNATFGVSVEWGDACNADANGDITLAKALRCRGGGKNALARHGTAALLNALSGGVDYALSTVEVKAIVKTALDSGDLTAILAAKDRLADRNEDGCPLN
ncbi:MAG TPA: hypothetical protein VFO62_04010 [Candidatus Binatia bacterium]|nr:hypothetical protein [Candidatus Binatia bacterium]